MAASSGSSRPLSLALFGFCFLCTAHAAWVIDGRGTRQVDFEKLLDAGKANSVRLAALQSTMCSSGDVVFTTGQTWTERCQQCTCTDSGTVCTGGPTCALPYHNSQELTCAKWSSNGCCCEQVGCLTGDGTLIPVKGEIPFNPARPCEKCTCEGGNRTSCLVKNCWPYQCVDMVAPKPGECCPSCPNGKSCVLPYGQWTQLTPVQQQTFQPIREFSPMTLRTGTLNEMTCVCDGNLVATCTETSPLKQGFRVLKPLK